MSGPQLTEVGTLMQKSIARRPLPTPPTKTTTPTQPATSTASTGGAKPLPTPPPKTVTPTAPSQPVVALEDTAKREEFVKRQATLDGVFNALKDKIGKLSAPPAAVAAALKTAGDAQTATEKAGKADKPDWAVATGELDTFERLTTALAKACVDAAATLAAGFTTNFTANKDGDTAGAEQIKLRIAYLKEQKKLDGLIASKDGIGALEACPTVASALAVFVAVANPSPSERSKTSAAALATVTGLSDSVLAAKSTTEKAHLAFDLCANGEPDSGPVLDQLCRIYRNSPQEPAFLAKREAERTKIAEKVSKIADVANLYKADGDLDEAKWNAVIADPVKVQALLKQVSDAQAEVLGLPPLEVTTYSTPSDGKSTDMGGCVWTATGLPTIELNAHPDAISSASEAMISILHETFHAQQDILVKKLMAGELDPTDPIYPQVLMYAANKPGNGYLPPSVDQDEYEAQPVEIDAETQGARAATQVFLAIKKAKTTPTGGGT